MRTRIYVVICPNGDRRLVDAASAAQAIRHVVENKYSAHVANQADFVEAMKLGLQVEYANRESASEETGEQLELPGVLNELETEPNVGEDKQQKQTNKE